MAADAGLIRRFKNFDAVQPEFPGGMNMTKIFQPLWEMIGALPQGDLIQEKDAEWWLRRTWSSELRTQIEKKGGPLPMKGLGAEEADEMMARRQPAENDFKAVFLQVAWHIRRAACVGGSEIGDVIAGWENRRGSFGDANRIARSKLLKLPPLPPTDAMMRGHRMEPMISGLLRERTGLVRDEAGMKALRGHRIGKMPWIAGNPDDLLMDPADPGAPRILPDYKAPSVDECGKYLEEGAPFGYAAQLHQYSFVAHDFGLKIDPVYKLVPFNYGPGDIAVIDVPHDPEMIRRISRASNWLWNDYVMQGAAPDPYGPEELQVEAARQEEVKGTIYVMAGLKGVVDAATKKIEELRQQVVETAGGDMAFGKIDQGFAALTVKEKWDEDALLALAERVRDFDLQAFRSDGKAYDPEKVRTLLALIAHARDMDEVRGILARQAEGELSIMSDKFDLPALAGALREQGVEVNGALSSSVRFDRTRAGKGLDFQIKEDIVAEANAMIPDIVGEFEEPSNKRRILRLVAEDDAPDMEIDAGADGELDM